MIKIVFSFGNTNIDFFLKKNEKHQNASDHDFRVCPWNVQFLNWDVTAAQLVDVLQ